jgi:N-acetylglucosaminyl-diphospho-decaprenol L-rhamnosyltransferase
MSAALTLNYRKRALTAACVRSLLSEGCERILVWDNSEDGGQDAEWLSAAFAGNSWVEIVCSPRNLGFAAGVNAGLSHLIAFSPAERVLLINNDATLEPGALDAMNAAMDGPTRPALVAPRVLHNGVEQGWMYYHRWLGLILGGAWPGTFPYLSGCCLLIDIEQIDLPLLDEDFFMYGEDVELSYRLGRQGKTQVFEASALIRHVGSAGSGSGTFFYEKQIVSCHFLLAKKLFVSGAQIQVARGLRWGALTARAAWRSLKLRSWIPFVVLYKSEDRADP